MDKSLAAERPMSVWWGPAAALAIGLPILLWGVLAHSAPLLSWFVPVCDGMAVVSMVGVAMLGALDAELRSNRRSLPIVYIASATAVMWIGHFALFPGDIPWVGGQRFNQAASTTFLIINLVTPLMLSVALLLKSKPIQRPSRSIALAVAAGAATGLLVLGCALTANLQTISPTGEFFVLDAIVGVAGLLPAVLGLLAFLVGLRGDERIAGGVLAALTFTALNSISLIYLHTRYSPVWYADHVMALLPFMALFSGQLWLYNDSVLAERSASASASSAAERRRIGLDIAETMATQTDPHTVESRLLSGVIEAVDADRVTMLRLVPGGYVVERSIDREGRPASIGAVLPLESVTSGDRKIVLEAVTTKRPHLHGSYRVAGLDEAESKGHAGIKQSIVMPLVRGGEVDGVLIVGRRADQPFTESDMEQLHELGAIAAQLIRNARLLSESESTSRAKSSFISLAAHELGTPISVIRGYADMLADLSLGEVSNEQRGPVEAIRSTVSELAERVEELLLATRLELSGSSPDPTETSTLNLNDVVREAVARAEKRARLIHADIATVLAPKSVVAIGNVRDVGVILDNVLNNAMTYNRPPVEVRVEVRSDPPEVRVRDNGIGIPDGAREQIFSQFYRVDDVEFGYPSGTGLGLYISRRLAEQMGAQLFVARTSGAGSEFVLRMQKPGSARTISQPEQSQTP